MAILNFFIEQKKLRRRKKLQRALSRRWLHTQICDLKAQPAHAAHQPQAARSQPNARGAVSQLGGAVRKRAASVPEARVGRQLGFQHPIAAARLPHRGQQPLAHGLGRELCVEDALGCGRQLLDQIEPRALVGCEASVSSTLSSSSSFAAGRGSRIWKPWRGRAAELPAGLGAGPPEPHGIDGEDLLPRKRAQPQLAGPSALLKNFIPAPKPLFPCNFCHKINLSIYFKLAIFSCAKVGLIWALSHQNRTSRGSIWGLPWAWELLVRQLFGCCCGCCLGCCLGRCLGCCLGRGCSLGRRLGLGGKSHPLGTKGEVRFIRRLRGQIGNSSQERQLFVP